MLYRLLKHEELLACYPKRHIICTENKLFLKLRFALFLFLSVLFVDVTNNCDNFIWPLTLMQVILFFFFFDR